MYQIFDEDISKKRKDIASMSTTPVDYNHIDTTAWLTSEEPIINDSTIDLLTEILLKNKIIPTDKLLNDIETWAIQSNGQIMINMLSRVVKSMLDMYQRSRNSKLTTYALQRVFGFEEGALMTYDEKAKELGITSQAVSKVCNKISDRFNVRSRTMHQRRDPRAIRKLKNCKRR